MTFITWRYRVWPDFRPIERVRYFIYGSREFKTVAFLPRQRRSSCPFSPRHPHLLFHYSLMHAAFRNDAFKHSDRLEWDTIAKSDSISNVVENGIYFPESVRDHPDSQRLLTTFDLCIRGLFSVQILRDRCAAALRRISITSTRCSWPSCILDRGSVFVRAALLGLGTALQVCFVV